MAGEREERQKPEEREVSWMGDTIREFWLESNAGAKARLIDYGATLVSLEVPDRANRLADVVLGFDDTERYRGAHPHFGATVGRYANRIAHGRFDLDGRPISVPANAGPHHLHGGTRGFDRVTWQAQPFSEPGGAGVIFRYRSVDGEQGYPGTLDVEVRYRLTHTNELWIDYEAATDAPTVVNLTNHSYFNLAGAGDILGHLLQLNASQYTPVDDALIPTGEIAPVEGTPLDFRQLRPIGSRIAEAGGYDHNFVLDRSRAWTSDISSELTLAAIVEEPESGRRMEVHTSQPGIQFYTSNSSSFRDGALNGKGNTAYRRYAALCLETQHFPDSPNHPAFPSTRLDVGQSYSHTTVHRFSAR